jgi:hypothetical protein
VRHRVVSVIAALVLAGCASRAADVTATYVSPMQYQAYTCAQLAAEAQRVSAAATAAAAAAGNQDSQATKDAVATAVGVIVFWPTLFLIGGDKQNAAQLAQLKGQMDAIEQTSIQKQCGIQFRTGPGPAQPPSASYPYVAPQGAPPPKG